MDTSLNNNAKAGNNAAVIINCKRAAATVAPRVRAKNPGRLVRAERPPALDIAINTATAPNDSQNPLDSIAHGSKATTAKAARSNSREAPMDIRNTYAEAMTASIRNVR